MRFFRPFLIAACYSGIIISLWVLNNSALSTGNVHAGDYFAPIDPLYSAWVKNFPFNHITSAGLEDSFHRSMVPLDLWHYLFGLAGATSALSTYSFIALILTISHISFFRAANYFYEKVYGIEDRSPWPAHTFSALYSISPYVIGLILPGHFPILLIYALFPLLIILIEKYLVNKEIFYLMGLSYFVFLAAAPAFANVGVIYACFLALAIYISARLITGEIKITQAAVTILALVLSLLLSNAWWLLSHITTLPRLAELAAISNSGMNNGLDYSSQYATLPKVFLLMAEGQLHFPSQIGHGNYISIAAIGWATIISLCGTALLFRTRNKIVLAFFITALCLIFLVKGTSPPISNVFQLMFDSIPGFGVLRRPSSKMYGWFIFFWLMLAYLFVANVASGFKNKWLIICFLVISASAVSWYSFQFVNSHSLQNFSVNPHFKQLNTILDEENAQRILVLPGNSALPPKSRRPEDYAGLDYTLELIRFPQITYDTGDTLIEERYKPLLKQAVPALLENGESICSSLKMLGISHILVRNDLNNRFTKLDPYYIMNVLNSQPYLERVSLGGEKNIELTLYRVDKVCRGDLIEISEGEVKQIRVIDPTRIFVDIEMESDLTTVILKTNKNSNWRVTAYQTCQGDGASSIGRLHLGTGGAFTQLDCEDFKNGRPLIAETGETKFYNEWSVNFAHQIPTNDTNKRTFTIRISHQNYWLLRVGEAISIATFFMATMILFRRARKLSN